MKEKLPTHFTALIYFLHPIIASKYLSKNNGTQNKHDVMRFLTYHIYYIYIDFRPVVYLPGKEFSVAARFSPIKYELRPVARVNGIKRSNHSNISPSDRTCEIDPEPELKPWEKYQTIFCLPYRMIYAVATQNSIMLHDTQQAEPFARISRLHYIGLNDLTW